MRPWLIGLTLVTLFVTIAACGGGGNPIVGKWSESGGTVTEFKDNGTIILSASGTAITGTYTLKDTTMVINITEIGAPITMTYSISGDNLTITDATGTATEFTRIK
jgi:DUF917 family protein